MLKNPRAVLLAGVAALAVSCRQPEADRPQGSPPTPAGSRSTRDPAERKPIPDVDLPALLSEVPEYRGQGRNLFGFGREEPRNEDPTLPDPVGTTEVPATAMPSTPPAPSAPPPPRIDLKLAGFVEKPLPEGRTLKYAVFLDGEEVLTGTEGDLVANRYRIITIGLESVVVGVEGSNVTQRIPLRTN